VGSGVAGGRTCQLADGREHYPPMPRQDADIFEVLISQMGERLNINPILSKALGVTPHNLPADRSSVSSRSSGSGRALLEVKS